MSFISPKVLAGQVNKIFAIEGPLPLSEANRVADLIRELDCPSFEEFCKEPFSLYLANSGTGSVPWGQPTSNVTNMTPTGKSETPNRIGEIPSIPLVSSDPNDDTGVTATAAQSNVRQCLQIIADALTSHPCWSGFRP